MGRQICAPSVVPASFPSQSVAELGVPTSSLTTQASITQSVIYSMTQSYDGSVQQSLKKLRHHSFVITDPHLRGHPIVYASDGFLHMTGYLAEEVMGRNPKFLQGADTDRQAVLRMRDSVCEEKPCQVIILNYTKQGWPFWILFHMAPVFSQTDGRLLHFVGAQTPLSDYSLGMKKQASSLSELHKGPYASSWHNSLLDTRITGSFSRLPCFKGHWLKDHCIGQKKRAKVASSVLQLVIHELTKSSELKNAEALLDRCINEDAEALHGRCISENAETALCSSLTLALTRIQQSFVISNPNLRGMPVVYASDMFLRLTGYEKEEVIGRNCSFLQGQDTDPCAIQQIRDCIKEEKACTVRILNHRKDGSSFWNLLHVAPVRDHTAKVAYFVGVQMELGTPVVGGCQASNIVPVMQQLGAVGAVKVAVRSLQGHGLRRSFGIS
uniref:Putative LOV domain-containing protein n=1 Tax=Dennstaedtia davallioides TaxID=1691968 RepID=A0A126X0K8_9MONI|nr:putative LOV domain-containing protein [Dennstaedtia davallioides]